MRPPALLNRFPVALLRPRPLAEPWTRDWPVVPEGAEEEFPALREDLELWRAEIEPSFRLLDHRAQVRQQRFWRQQVTLILGGLVATVLGAAQTAVGGGNVPLAVAAAVLTATLTAVAALARERPQREYLTDRLKAERIKSEFFLYLGRSGDYAGEGRASLLRRRVEDVVDAEEAP